MSKSPSRSSDARCEEDGSVSKSFKVAIVQRVFRNFLDVMLLKLVQKEPMWGYKIIKEVEKQHEVCLRHGALYPLLNRLERKGFVRSRDEIKEGRTRKVYEITLKGVQFVEAYDEFMIDQIPRERVNRKRR